MAMDDNNDGTLSVAELKEGLTKANTEKPTCFLNVVLNLRVV